MVLLEPRVKQLCEVNCQCDFLDIFKENANSRKHNHQMLQSIPGVLHKITVINHSPKKVSNHLINEVPNRSQSQTDELAQILKVKAEARVMLTVNIDLD